MKKKILSICAVCALIVASLCVTVFSVAKINASADESEVLLYTLDFTDIPRDHVDATNANSININNLSFEAWEEAKLSELEALGFTMGDEFNLGGHDSKFFYQTISGDVIHAQNFKYDGDGKKIQIDPYAFFLKFEGGTSFEKKLENETRVKIYVDPVQYYWHGAIDYYYDDADSNNIQDVYYSEMYRKKTRTEPVSLKINDVVVSDNVGGSITGVIEQDLRAYDSVKIEQHLKGVTVYKIEFYGIEDPAPAPTVEEESGFEKFLSNIGLGALPIGASILVLIAAFIVVRKVLK